MRQMNRIYRTGDSHEKEALGDTNKMRRVPKFDGTREIIPIGVPVLFLNCAAAFDRGAGKLPGIEGLMDTTPRCPD